MTSKTYKAAVVVSVGLGLCASPAMATWPWGGPPDVEEVLALAPRPFGIGHRGAGENAGEDPELPIENTAESVALAFESGLPVVEVDVVLTRDGRAVALHDDFLPDGTCVNELSWRELRDALPHVSTLRRVLTVARWAGWLADAPSGVLDVELKAPSPMCDLGDETEDELVRAAVRDVYRTRMQDHVLIESLSPALLLKVADRAPSLPLVLTMNLVQFLTPEQAEAILGLPVTFIDKSAGLGLQWGEIGGVFRLPSYSSVQQLVETVAALSARGVSLDLAWLQQAEQTQPGSAAQLIALLQSQGVLALAYTADDAGEWDFLQALGADGIFTNDVHLP